MADIRFANLEISKSRVTVQAEYTESIELYFDFDRAVRVTSTQVALSMATLCGTAFESIEFDFEVDRNVLSTIERVTRATVEAPAVDEYPVVTSKSGNVLSFSGGFDSLSALRLMPKDTNLVSMDFGGWFEREAEFFRSFETLTISTNIRSVPTRKTPLTRNHWSFMAIGAILTAGYFNARYHTFGQILGESLARLSHSRATLPVLSELGFLEAGYARGITEVGTVSVILQSDPFLVEDSLKSLAGPRDRKLFRKDALARLSASRLGAEVRLPDIDASRSPKIKYGDDFASSLAALYCISRDSEELIGGLFEYIPGEAVQLARSVSMEFMHKVNWDAYSGFPAELRGGLWDNLLRYGFEPYTENDWDEVKIVREHLAAAAAAVEGARS